MKRAVIPAGMAVLALAGCGTAAAPGPSAAVTPSASAAAQVVPEFACTVTRTGGATPAVQFSVTARNPGGQPVSIGSVSVVFTNGNGQQLYSNPDVPFSATVAAGQSQTSQVSSDGAPGITGCQIEGWSQ